MGDNIFVVTASAQYLSQGISELQELDGSVRVARLLDNGIAVIETQLAKQEFIKTVRAGRPVFIRHMHAVDHIVAIDGDGPRKAAEAVSRYTGIVPGQKVAVQVRKGMGEYAFSPMDVKNAVDVILADNMGAVPEVKEPEVIISILLMGEKCCMGLGTPCDNLSGWSGGMLHYRKSDSDISRAKFKLMEAIEVFRIDMESFRSALDLGAAPGGWTSVLLEYGLQVTAVDTGDMDSRLERYPGFKFIKANASELMLPKESFGLLTSDISWNPKNTARMIINASEFLEPGGRAVVTLKLMGGKVRRTIREVLNLYKEVFEILEVKQLFHNRDEVTLYLKKYR